MRTLAIIALLLCVAPLHAQPLPYTCTWVLGQPGAWPPCTGGMRTRYTPYVTSVPDCVPAFHQPLDLQETEACTNDSTGHQHVGRTKVKVYRIHIPAGLNRTRCPQTITIEATDEYR